MTLGSPLCMTPSQVLELSQETSHFLKKNASSGTSTISLPLLSIAETPDLWTQFEHRFLSCLNCSDDRAAHLCLERLVDRFGTTNERIMGLRGIYQEAVARDDDSLARILHEYDDILIVDPMNGPVAKRRIALLRCLSRSQDAIDALVRLLESSPTDVEAWAELAELYFSQDLFSQAIFCLEEVLLLTPNAWNVGSRAMDRFLRNILLRVKQIHARIGEMLFASETSSNGSNDGSILVEAIRRFCRSIELCEDYLRGYFGLELTTRKLLAIMADKKKHSNSTDDSNLPASTRGDIESLHSIATSGLLQIVRKGTDRGFKSAEIVAARILLNEISQPAQC